MKTKTMWTVGAVAMGLLMGLTTTPPARADELTPSESESLLAPLPRTDPRAQADPTLEGLPNAPVAQATAGKKKLSKRRATRTEGHDVATGRSRRERTRPPLADGSEVVSRDEIGAAWREIMGRNYPAMALVEVKGLVESAAKVEIETTAVVEE